ncbi:MAG: superoxide dismutase [Phycisphaerae bacterium]
MSVEVEALPYAYDALEPTIDKQTMELHHDKHYATYVSKYNDAVAGTELEGKPLVEVLSNNLAGVPDNIKTTVRNNGGGAINHALFWQIMGGKGGTPSGSLGQAINSTFGSFDAFKAEVKKAATGQFGSGWAWLVKDGSSLKVIATANQDSPHMTGMTPILGIDVWEHAYYLKYNNRRPDYVDAFWDVVNWDKCQEIYSS